MLYQFIEQPDVDQQQHIVKNSSYLLEFRGGVGDPLPLEQADETLGTGAIPVASLPARSHSDVIRCQWPLVIRYTVLGNLCAGVCVGVP